MVSGCAARSIGKVAGPNRLGIQRPRVFQRAVLHCQRAIADASVISRGISATISQARGSYEVAVQPAVPTVDAVAIGDLMIEFDIELIVRAMRQAWYKR